MRKYTKYLLGLCLLLVASATMPRTAAAQEVYAVKSTDGTKLTFYCDADRESREGTIYSMPGTDQGKGSVQWLDERITTVEFDPSFAKAQITRTAYWFYGLSSLTSIVGMEYLNTSNVASMYYMFDGCSSLTSLDLSNFDTSSATSMRDMFEGCSSLTQLDLSKFNTQNVTNMEKMFTGCTKLASLTLPQTFSTSKVTTMSNMFQYCSSLTQLDLSMFNTSLVTNMGYMFDGCSALATLDLSSFNTQNVSSAMDNMFFNCSSLTQLDLSGFNTAKVTSMANMFRNCSKLSGLDLSSFDTSNTTSTYAMFQNCSAASRITLGEKFTAASSTNMASMFAGCSSLTELDLSHFETQNVTTMANMFSGCSKLASISLPDDLSTSKVTSMANMFSFCKSLKLKTLPETFDTSSVTDMTYMFFGCTSIDTLRLPKSFDTSNVTSMNRMFNTCNSLKYLSIPYFNTEKVTNAEYMFTNVGGNAPDPEINCTLNASKNFFKSSKIVEETQASINNVYGCSKINYGYFNVYLINADTNWLAHAEFEKFDGVAVRVKTQRTLAGGGKYNTYCLPFDVDREALDEALGSGYELEKFTSAEYDDAAGHLILNFSDVPADEGIKAGTPYFITGLAADVVNPEYYNVTIRIPSSDADSTTTVNYSDGTITFYGVSFPARIKQKDDEAKRKYVIFTTTSGQLKYPSQTSGNAIKGQRGYFIINPNTASGAKPSLSMKFSDPVVTEVRSVEYRVKDSRGATYSIDGQRVSGGYRGIVVRDGKKILQR